MIPFFVVAGAAFAAMMAIYFIVKHFASTWGTITANLAVALPVLLDMGGALPWGNIMDEGKVKAVMFAFALGNILIRFIGTKPQVKMPFAGKMR